MIKQKAVFLIYFLISISFSAKNYNIGDKNLANQEKKQSSKGIDQNISNEIVHLIGKEGNTYYIILSHQKTLYFFEFNSDDQLSLENNRIQLSKNDRNTDSFEFDITKNELTFNIPNHLNQKIIIKQYPKIGSKFSEDEIFKKLNISTIGDFDASFRDTTFPVQFKMLLMLEHSDNTNQSKDITDVYISFLLKKKQYDFAKHLYTKYYTNEKQESYFVKNYDINNIIFNAIENEDIEFLSTIPIIYLEQLLEIDKNVKINSLGYSIIKFKTKSIKFLSEKLSKTSITLQDNAENKTYRYLEALQIFDDKKLLKYVDLLLSTSS